MQETVGEKLRLETDTRPLRRRTKKEKKSGEDGSYWTAQVAMETEEERKERLKKMVANHSPEVSPWDRGWKKS